MFKGITKKIIAVTVAVVCIAVASPIDAWAIVSAYFDATGNETSWDKEVYRGALYGAGESDRDPEHSYDFNWAMITEYKGGETDILTIPETLRCSGDYTVKYIYNGVFQGCTAKKIIIPGTVDIIEGSAFQDCVNLEEINIPDGVVTIEQSTFAGCKKLNNITLPSSLGVIRESAFDGCQSLTSITIPSNVSVVYNNAFANCSSLESVVIEDASKFTSFSNSAFESCPSINAIEIKTATDVSQIENILTIVSADSTTPTRTIKVPSQYVKEIKQDASFSKYNVCDLEGNPALASVSFQANGHGTAPANANIALGNKIVAPTAPTAEGYTFAGWYKEAACTNAWNFATDTVMDDVTLYAKWIRHEPDAIPSGFEIPTAIDSATARHFADFQGNQFYKDADGTVVCYDSANKMVRNNFVCDGTSTYYIQYDGTAMTDRLTYHPDGEHVIYFDDNGHEVFSDFAHITKTISGETVDDNCFFDINGYLYVDVVTYDKTGTVIYYANAYGLLERGKWFQFSPYAKWAGFTEPDPQFANKYGYANADMSLLVNQNTTDWKGRACYLQGNGTALYQ